MHPDFAHHLVQELAVLEPQPIYIGWNLDRHFPELTERYAQIAFSTGHSYWTALRQGLHVLQSEKGLNLRIGV